jgi:hypothetical protein
MIDRRGFLALSAVAAAGTIGACSSRTTGPAVTKQAGANTGAVDIAIDAAETQIDLGGVSVRTWAWAGRFPARKSASAKDKCCGLR